MAQRVLGPRLVASRGRNSPAAPRAFTGKCGDGNWNGTGPFSQPFFFSRKSSTMENMKGNNKEGKPWKSLRPAGPEGRLWAPRGFGEEGAATAFPGVPRLSSAPQRSAGRGPRLMGVIRSEVTSGPVACDCEMHGNKASLGEIRNLNNYKPIPHLMDFPLFASAHQAPRWRHIQAEFQLRNPLKPITVFASPPKSLLGGF